MKFQVCPFTNRRMSSTATIATVQGALRGKQECSKSGFKYYSFKGIPYAKPPVGSLRFKVKRCICTMGICICLHANIISVCLFCLD